MSASQNLKGRVEERPNAQVHLFGFSMGGMIAQEIAWAR